MPPTRDPQKISISVVYFNIPVWPSSNDNLSTKNQWEGVVENGYENFTLEMAKMYVMMTKSSEIKTSDKIYKILQVSNQFYH